MVVKGQYNYVKKDWNDEQRNLVIFFWDTQLAVIGDKEKEKGRHKTGAGIHYLDCDYPAPRIPAGYFGEVAKGVEKEGNDNVHKTIAFLAPAAFQGNDTHVDRKNKGHKNKNLHN